MAFPGLLRASGAALLDLALPSSCAGCAQPGAGWCEECSGQFERLTAHPALVVPAHPPGPLPPVVAAGPYCDVVRRAVVAFKDDGRRDLAPVLAHALAAAVRPFVAALGPVSLVPVPSTPAARRHRGDAPVEALAARSALLLAPPPRVVAGLRVARPVTDQSRLGRGARADNLAGAHRARTGATARAAGTPVVLVDDVVTTGATLAEATRAWHWAGGTVQGAAVIAATPLQRRGSSSAGG